MRVAPIGVFFAEDLERVVTEAERSASPTHTHEIGVDAARLMAVAAAMAARSAGKVFSREDFLKTLLQHVSSEEFQWQISHAIQLPRFASLVAFGNSLEANRSTMSSVMCFVDSPDNYEEVISRAIGLGDDVDTLAAMAGALSGARLGASALPASLINCLENEHQGRDFLIGLAEQLWQRFERSG